MKKCSGLYQERNLRWSNTVYKPKQSKTASKPKQICGWILMWETTGDGLFHWRKRWYRLWAHILGKNILIMDLFLTNMQLLASQDVNWWTGLLVVCGVDHCDVFISCLDSHSDGTHSLLRIHWWWIHWSKCYISPNLFWFSKDYFKIFLLILLCAKEINVYRDFYSIWISVNYCCRICLISSHEQVTRGWPAEPLIKANVMYDHV